MTQALLPNCCLKAEELVRIAVFLAKSPSKCQMQQRASVIDTLALFFQKSLPVPGGSSGSVGRVRLGAWLTTRTGSPDLENQSSTGLKPQNS